ncbi:MAG: arylsulfatase [Nocardioides sp.]|uniref:arylsulfatase n=1 Tax=Nocardioides sp. TaxID=35761 RepID=UPI003F00DDEF
MSLPDLARRSVLRAAAASTVVGASAGTSLAAAPQASAARRPDVVLILVDDLGFSDISRFGSEIPTPHIDQIGESGTTFTNFYNNARCCPTRASVLTGLYPTTAGVGHMNVDQGSPQYRGHLAPEAATLAESLGAAGYRTSMSGKWHLGEWRTGVRPSSRGFDRSYGILDGYGSYFRPQLFRNDRRIGRPTSRDFYLTDAIADHAVESIEQFARGDRPFFSYVAFTGAHWPLHAPEEDVAQFRGRYLNGWDEVRRARFERQRDAGLLPGVTTPGRRDGQVPQWSDVHEKSWQDRRMAVYAAQVHRLDVGVGRVLDALERTGRRDNTLVLFLSDNGGCAEALGAGSAGQAVSVDGARVRAGNDPTIWPGASDTYASYGRGWAHVSNTPFASYKHFTDEGGISTPLLASLPARFTAGGVSHAPLHVVDLVPTVLDVTGTQHLRRRRGRRTRPLAGRSFAAVAAGRDNGAWTAHRSIFWEHEGNRAVRRGRWKLVARHGRGWRLYDLEADRTESRNVARRHPWLVAELSGEWRRWARRVGVRRWRSRGGYRGAPLVR